MKPVMAGIALATVLMAAGACGNDDGGRRAAAGSGTDGAAAAGGKEGRQGRRDAALDSCGNGRLDPFEQCDDGNLDNRDGCTTLCEYTCTLDEDCDDLNVCNGVETCEPDHTCKPGENLEDGADCGHMRSCENGICVEEVCGDQEVGEEEECDDGNTDDNDGCTAKCRYTCHPDDPERDCSGGDICPGTDTCDLRTHTCVGTPLEDHTTCTIVASGKIGWCIDGECVPTVCGDGIRGGAEECDDGDRDNKDGCTRQCKFTCVRGDPERDCSGGDPCAGKNVCDRKTHTCVGDPLEDETTCTMVDSGEIGWCMRGVCVPTDCGDGIVGGAEECDDGALNGTIASNCAIDCTLAVCGNGVIDGNQGEQCDGTDLGGESCITLGHSGGLLICDMATCTFDTSMCIDVDAAGYGVDDAGYDDAGN